MDAKGNSWERRTAPSRRRRDLGKSFARVLCVLFALVGAIPLTGGVFLRSEPIKRWAASETSRVLREQLGVVADFTVELELIPLRLAIRDLVVPASDGRGPALTTALAAVSPRFFSLLAGRIDVGDVELEDSAIRLVLEGGEIKNVAYRFPQTKSGQRPQLTRSPFRSLSISGATLDVTVDDARFQTGAIDVDILAEPELAFDVALRVGGATFDGQRALWVPQARDSTPPPGEPEVSYDEDRLCALDLRAYVSEKDVVIRRFSLLAGIDLDPLPDTRPECGSGEEGRVALRLSQVKVEREGKGIPHVRGHVMARAPAALANRFAPLQPFRGWAGFSGEVAYDGKSRLPELEGQLTGENLGMGRYAFAQRVEADLQISGDVVRVPSLEAAYGNGTAWITDLSIAPFQEKMPVRLATLRSKDVDFPGLMRDTGAAPNTIVDWNFGDMTVTGLAGTLAPFYLDAQVLADTRDFQVSNRAYHDPGKQRMIGVSRGRVAGRFRAHAKALEFYDTETSFGNSRLPVELVSIGWKNDLVVRLGEGGVLDLADISPIAGIDVAGIMELQVAMKGPAAHPVLEGDISVAELMVGGFEAGDLHRSEVRFEPLFVDFIEAEGKKGDMTYTLPIARLAFDGAAGVEFSGVVESPNFVIREFFDIFRFDEDPRFDEIEGRGTASAQVRYLLGGPEDTCEGGRLQVSGTTDLAELSLFGENFDDAEGDFDFEWFDMKAGSRGMRLLVPSVALSKGTGTMFGTARLTAGGHLTGDLVGTRVPVSQVDLLGGWLGQVDGYVTGAARIDGNVEALAFTSDLALTELKAGEVSLPASSFSVNLEPASRELPTSGELTACGRRVPPEFSLSEYEEDASDGTFRIDGSFFGGQVTLDDISISRQRARVVRGQVALADLDIGALSALTGTTSLPLLGTVTGSVAIDSYYMDRPFDGSLALAIEDAKVSQGGLSLSLIEGPSTLRLEDGTVASDDLSFAVKTAAGQTGVLDARLSLDRTRRVDAELRLRETSLGVIAETVPGVSHAEGRLLAGFSVKGPLRSPEVDGKVQIKEGRVVLSALPTEITNLEVEIAVDRKGLGITRGDAEWGGGTVSLRGGAPLARAALGDFEVTITGRGISLPLGKDARATFNSDLRLSVPAGDEELPRLAGSLDLLSSTYKRSMNVTADIGALTARGKKTDVQSYDPDKDNLRLDVLLRARKPVVVQNDLVDATLALDPQGLRITGTDQRFGVVGSLELPAGGRIYLRDHEFEIQNGLVRFSDPTRLRPEVDVAASTEFRRYGDRGGSAGVAASTATTTSGTPVAGNWRILLHAYGSPENLKVDLTSSPPLAQDDIFLLLAVGLTRTELNQSRSDGVGSSVALEALGSLSGAESAVTNAVPVDEFRFGSTYSSRSGRTEPTVTIGKRLSDRIRASVTTSISDASEIRSNVEYRATGNLSVEGSYDNAQSSGSTTVGNIGGDVRWRLEFE